MGRPEEGGNCEGWEAVELSDSEEGWSSVEVCEREELAVDISGTEAQGSRKEDERPQEVRRYEVRTAVWAA